MTRASLGYSGMPLHAGWPLHLAAAGWVLAFLTFAVVYAPLFVKRGAAA